MCCCVVVFVLIICFRGLWCGVFFLVFRVGVLRLWLELGLGLWGGLSRVCVR